MSDSSASAQEPARLGVRPHRRARVEVWLNSRPWWQELTVAWVTMLVATWLGDLADAAALRRGDLMPHGVLDLVIPATLAAPGFTAVRRWKRRYDRREDVD